jgi:hypothetical protein
MKERIDSLVNVVADLSILYKRQGEFDDINKKSYSSHILITQEVSRPYLNASIVLRPFQPKFIY